MLAHLSIRGFAIIDALELGLAPGMTVLTGETGAGKSIVVDALALIAGGRARADVIRAGEEEAEIAAQFVLGAELSQRVAVGLDEAGLPGCDDGALVVRRLISRAGRHRQFINGSLATVAQLKELVAPLIDFTGQHAQQALLRPGSHLALLDAWAGHGPDVEAARGLYERARSTEREIEELTASERQKVERGEWLRFQLDEIDAVRPEPGEEQKLAGERTRLKNVVALRSAVADALAGLTEGGSEDGRDALSAVQQAAADLGRLAGEDRELGQAAETLEEAAALIDDAARSLTRSASSLEDDPERLEVVEERLDALRTLMRKHGGSLDAVLEAEGRMADELDTLEHAEERMAELRRRLEEERDALVEVARRLTKKRRAAARRFGREIEAELADLGMGGARLEVAVEALPASSESALVAGSGEARRGLGPTGADRVELRLAANPGEPGGPLAKVASGGELSRVLLGIKRVLLATDPAPLSIFDEVDAGVGGAVGEVIGDKLRAVAAGRQVICVTHLPQIAALGDAHLRVEKRVEQLDEIGPQKKRADKQRTVSRVVTLDEEARVEELSRMLGGKKITDRTRAHAREMLQAGG